MPKNLNTTHRDLADIHSVIFPIDYDPFGLSYSKWTAKWWEWILKIPKVTNPLFDMSGVNAHINQFDKNVFFLCQTLESTDRISQRTITIPKCSSIFMPIINWLSILHEDGETDDDLLFRAKERMDVVKDLNMVIDGIVAERELIRKFRFRSPFIDIILPEGNLFDKPAGPTRVVSDGYWFFLKPLSKNTMINSFGSCSSGITKIRSEYRIIVV